MQLNYKHFWNGRFPYLKLGQSITDPTTDVTQAHSKLIFNRQTYLAILSRLQIWYSNFCFYQIIQVFHKSRNINEVICDWSLKLGIGVQSSIEQVFYTSRNMNVVICDWSLKLGIGVQSSIVDMLCNQRNNLHLPVNMIMQTIFYLFKNQTVNFLLQNIRKTINFLFF